MSITYHHTVTDAYRGTVYGTVAAYDEDIDKIVGGLDYVGNDDDILIEFIKVYEEYQRQGIGTALVKRLQEEFPDANIDFGTTTEEGENLRKKFSCLRKAIVLIAQQQELEAQMFAPEKSFYEEQDVLSGDAPWLLTQEEYVNSPRGFSNYLKLWERYSDLDPNDPENIEKAKDTSIEDHKRAIQKAIYRGEDVPDNVLVDYPEFLYMSKKIDDSIPLNSIDITSVRRPNHVYRAMSPEEYENTVGVGRGVWSDKRSCFTGEGTCFATDPATSVSYGIYTGSGWVEEFYLVEVLGSEDILYKDIDDYVKTKDKDLWIPQENVTRVWRIYREGEDYMIQEI